MITNVCKDLLKQVAKSLWSGKLGDLMKMRTPAYCHASETYLDCIRYEFYMLEEFIFLCQKNGHMNDPVERMKYIAAAQIASIYTGID